MASRARQGPSERTSVNSGDLVAAILEGDSGQAVLQTRLLSESGVSPERIVVDGVEAAMLQLDTKCTAEDFDLLEIMLSGRAVTEVMRFLYPAGAPIAGAKGTVVIATPEGDVHDLGKGIFKMILIGNGYRVVDLGRDCPLAKLVDATERERPLAVGLSGLITTIIPQVRKVKDLLVSHELHEVKVLAGGAALKQSSASGLNVDFVADSAFDGVHYLNEILKGRK